MSEDFNEPDQGFSGERIQPRDVVGHLLMVWCIEYVEHSQTRYSKPGVKSDMVVVDVVDLDQVGEDGLPGALGRGIWWRQSRLIQALKNSAGKTSPFLGWMTTGMASQGNNAPYILQSATQDPDAVNRARAWLAAHPQFTISSPTPTGDLEETQEYQQPVAIAYESPAPVAKPEAETVLQRMARIARDGADRLPPPPPGADGPGF